MLDVSGSSRSLFRSGAYQVLIDRFVAAALLFDDNGTLDTWLFDHRLHEAEAITMANREGWTDRQLARKDIWGMTEYAKPIDKIADGLSRGGRMPTYVAFITDGANHDKRDTTKAIQRASGLPAFFQFMAIGKANDFPFLQRLDELTGREIDNAGFFAINDPQGISDDEFYDKVMIEFPAWLEAARRAGILQRDELVQERGRLPDLSAAASPTPTATGSAIWAGSSARLDHLAELGRRRALALADLPLAAGRRGLRHQRLPGHRAGVRDARAVRRAAGGRARARDEADHGPGRQPHLRRAPVVRGVALLGRRPSATGTGGAPTPPNDWRSFFSGPAWELDEATGEYYLHLFSRKQPDLNWENPEVRAAIYSMMRWWLDRGVDGFRMDVINLISKPPGLPDGDAVALNAHGPRLHEFLQEMHREVFAGRDGLLTVGEMPGVTRRGGAAVHRPGARARSTWSSSSSTCSSTRGRRRSGTCHPLRLLDLKASLGRWQDGLADVGWNSPLLEQPRPAAGGLALRRRRRAPRGRGEDARHGPAPAPRDAVRLPGRGARDDERAVGDDRGLPRHRVAQPLPRGGGRRAQSPDDVLLALRTMGRDNARTPMQWTAGPHAGFTTGEPWLPVNPNHVDDQRRGRAREPGLGLPPLPAR